MTALMMDNRKRPLDGMSGPADNPPASKRLQVDSQVSSPTVNGTHRSISPASKVKSETREEDSDDDDEGQNPAYKGLDVSHLEIAS